MSGAADLLRALAPVLERFGNRWYVFGAQAVIVWGRPRLTADDSLDLRRVRSLLGLLEEALGRSDLTPALETRLAAAGRR